MQLHHATAASRSPCRCRPLASAHGSLPSPCESWTAAPCPSDNGLRLLAPPQRCSSPERPGSAARRRNIRPEPAWSSSGTDSVPLDASHCDLSQHRTVQQQPANLPHSSTQSAVYQSVNASRAQARDDGPTPRRQQMAQRQPVLLRLSRRRMHQPDSSAVRSSATACVRLLTARAAQASQACRRARLLRLSLGIRSRGNVPRPPPPTFTAGRAAHGTSGARGEERVPSGWHLRSLRLLRVPRARASMRASARGRILTAAYPRAGPAAQVQPCSSGRGISKHWHPQPGRALGACRAGQMPLTAQRPLRPSSVAYCPRCDEQSLPRCPARITKTMCTVICLSLT